MLYFSKWKTLAIIGAILLGFFFAFPNVIPAGPSDNPEAV